MVGQVYGTAVATVELVLGSGMKRRAEPNDSFFFLAVEHTAVNCKLRVLGQDGAVLETTDDLYVPIVSTAAQRGAAKPDGAPGNGASLCRPTHKGKARCHAS